MNKIDDKKSLIYVILSMFFIITIILFSHYYFLSKYKKLEISQNNNNLQKLFTKIDEQIQNIQNITLDYALWDDTYEFVHNINKDFIYENFRKGSNALENLDLDLIIIENKEKETLFSYFTQETKFIKKENFEIIVKKYFKNKKSISKILEYKNQLFIISKNEILKSDSTGEVRGYLYLGKYLSNKELKKYNNSSLKIVSIKEKINFKNKTNYKSEFFDDIYVSKELSINNLKNRIFFINKNNSFSLEFNKKPIFFQEGRMTILIYDFIFILFSIIIFILAYSHKKVIDNVNNNLEVLVLKRTTQMKKTMSKLETANEMLYNLAHTDFLTKINNRRNYFILSQRAYKKTLTHNLDISVIMIDLDNFKQINDTYGHDVGDKILIQFTNTIKSLINKEEIFGRLGGEEFAITLPEINLEEANKKAEILRNSIEHIKLELHNKDVRITASFGLADNNKSSSIDEMLLKADKHLYSAKKSGKNLVRSRLTLI